MKLYVARHTQTNYNLDRLCNADPSVDVHLTEHGIDQAKSLAEKLADQSFEVIYISELPRTRQTAEFINQHHNVPVIVEGRLNDNKTGFEGRPVTEYMAALHEHQDIWHATLNDGESLAEAQARVRSFLDELRDAPYESVMIVTHGYIVECIHGIINDWSYEEAAEYTSTQVTQGIYFTFSL